MTKLKYNINNLSKAISDLSDYQKKIRDKTKILMSKLAELGVENMKIGFSHAIYDGVNDTVVNTPTWQGDKLIISASGSSILFIEFGAGIHYAADSHPMASKFGYVRGGYGYGLGKRDSWRYKGDPGTNGVVVQDGKHKGEVITHGNPANRVVYDTSKLMRAEILKIAKEVFRE